MKPRKSQATKHNPPPQVGKKAKRGAPPVPTSQVRAVFTAAHTVYAYIELKNIKLHLKDIGFVSLDKDVLETAGDTPTIPACYPPAKAIELIDLLCEPKKADVLIGDITEGFHKRLLRGDARAASRWVWAQAMRSVGPLLWAAGKRLAGAGATWKAAELAWHFVWVHWQ